MEYKGITTYSYFIIPYPSYSFAYIINILTCCGNNEIT